MKKGKREKILHLDVIALLKKLEIIIRILVNTQVMSRYRSVFKGKGLEFEDYRVYAPEDDAKSIDWKASVRSNEILVKEYKEERDLDVYFLLDTSSSMIFGSTEKLKLEYAAEFVAAFSYFVMKAGDKAGLIMFNDKVVNMIPTATGEQHFHMILRSLVNVDFYGGGYDLKKAIDFLMKTTKEKGLLVIVSDFIGLEREWDKIIKKASVVFDVIGVMVRDPRDEKLPKEIGQVVIEDPYTESNLVVNSRMIAPAYERFVSREEETIMETFLESNADFLKLLTYQPFTKILIEFLIKRRQRILM
ncbi:MAG: DUF58 domain-containing protein [Candidatus Aenigmarchaeota archaeon]|nr:DUF58 domain-containing protein [Candidatus Aenigmarchaeota archaeon]NIP41069.1 DUF58 domain-containing protein [Candidatus Aenigmarchaeota archaeon]NIQ17471.1 DUF58 domain-containing protein [Candidatus Aenigmarchaeota archaeon]NIS73665.1 DUF58 domain-containing protein [Candidatus Aenigmarchaeota archaeon]